MAVGEAVGRITVAVGDGVGGIKVAVGAGVCGIAVVVGSGVETVDNDLTASAVALADIFRCCCSMSKTADQVARDPYGSQGAGLQIEPMVAPPKNRKRNKNTASNAKTMSRVVEMQRAGVSKQLQTL